MWAEGNLYSGVMLVLYFLGAHEQLAEELSRPKPPDPPAPGPGLALPRGVLVNG